MKNTILSLVTAQRVKLEEPGVINAEILGFTRALGTGFVMELERDAIQALSVAINRKVPLEHDGHISPVTKDEMKVALKSVKNDRAQS
ncbi:hypothetical protein RHMOL_Rhmol13G0000700 [Rhododendron molle]|uniref:Uncharacterized protein n=1 Tax=Rhododendron molle TaxID=49168 RepID=A0ACC0L1X1_RHOML|nr:hypothetical protein RHMOL_Rhmol13G0000700 [Rhododendron molle]